MAGITPAALGAKDAAAYIGHSLREFERLVKAGEITALAGGSSGGKRTFRVADLDRWLATLPPYESKRQAS